MSKHLTPDKMTGIDTLGIEEAKMALKYSLLADQPINLIGAPGVGKSAIVSSVAKELNMEFVPLILSLCDPTDIGGFPVAQPGSFERLPLGPIKRACENPVLLFLDELTCASPAVQGAAMRLVYERWAGDVKLHPGTRIVAASNPPEQAAGGWELALPLLGRMTQIKLVPNMKEIQTYFYALGDSESALRLLGVDLAATLELAPELMQIEPPAGQQAAGKPWGAPRSWERALRVLAQIPQDEETHIVAAALAGNVGEDQAAAYMTIRKVRDQLPTITDILTNPNKAKLPTSVNSQIAVLGILAQVAHQNPCPAWVYSNRLGEEIRIAAMNTMGKFAIKSHAKSPFYKEAVEAQKALLQTIGKAIQNS